MEGVMKQKLVIFQNLLNNSNIQIIQSVSHHLMKFQEGDDTFIEFYGGGIK